MSICVKWPLFFDWMLYEIYELPQKGPRNHTQNLRYIHAEPRRCGFTDRRGLTEGKQEGPVKTKANINR